MQRTEQQTATIRRLNDEFRRTGAGGRIYVTPGINALPQETQGELISRIRRHETFDPENDPYGEHDFASFTVEDQKAYFKIDYYNADTTAGSEDPADPALTTRVMTIMLAHEY